MPFSGIKKSLYILLGCGFVGLGIVGTIVPLMPTTIFLLLAAACFARSSPRLEAWLLGHPRFGGVLRAWRQNRAIPRTAKIAACTGMAVGFALFLTFAHPAIWVVLIVAACLTSCALYIVSRPVA